MTAERDKIETGSVNARILYGLEGWVDENFNPRVDGFSKLNGVDARVPPLAITPATLFNEWRENRGSFEEERKRVLEGELEILLASSPTRTLMIRQAYKVPGIDKPFGIRSSAASVEKALSSIEDHFAFFQEQGYDQIPGAESVVFIYGRIDPPPFPEVPQPSDPSPRGGMAAKVGDNVAKVYGTFGDNETTTVYQPDVWTVVRHPDGTFGIIDDETVIAQKRHMLIRPPSGEKPDIVAVPEDRQLRWSLTPAEIQEAARVALDVSEAAGKDQRVEFANGLDADGQLKMFFLESAPYERVEIKEEETGVYEGNIDFIIDNAADAELLLEKLGEGEEIRVVHVTPDLVARQEETALLLLERANQGLTVLYPGDIGTTHRNQILEQIGHKTILCGVRKFSLGDEIKISSISGVINIENLSGGKEAMLLPLEQGFLAGLEKVGGKALRLSEIAGQGIKTPGGFVVTTEAMNEVLEASGLSELYDEFVGGGSLDVALDLAEKLRKAQLVVSKNLSAEFLRAQMSMRAESYFVRSSAWAEDDPRANFAGKYRTVGDARSLDDIRDAYVEVVSSAFEPDIIRYAFEKGVNLRKATQVAALIQPDVEPRQSGVAFRRHSLDDENILIEGVRGKASGIVDGRRSPDKIVCDHRTGDIVSRRGSEALSEEQISAVSRMTAYLSRMFGAPQDVEWAFNQEGQLIVLQSRDQRLG